LSGAPCFALETWGFFQTLAGISPEIKARQAGVAQPLALNFRVAHRSGSVGLFS
jgi:hypothetical protein